MKSLILSLFLSLCITALSQVAVPSGSYFQDFGTTAVNSWINNSTYPGWYQSGTFQSHVNITNASPVNTGGFYTYECNGNNDQKIGSRPSNSTNTITYGLVLQNTTGLAISHVKISYKGYQLSLAQNGATNVITFDYVVGAAAPALNAGGGTAVSALNFTQLQSNGSSGSNQVMGYPCTQVVTLSSCITVNIPNNSYILLRWTDVNDAGNDHHMAIDDVDIRFLAANPTVNSAVICASQTVALTANGAASYAWSPPTGLSATTGSVVTANPTSTTVYTVVASVPSCPSKSVTSTVTVNSNPSISVNSATVCASGTATLTATGAASYTWSPALTLSSSTGNTVAANPTSTTIYTITGSAGACAISPATATVTVVSGPAISVNSASICASDNATLTASGAGSYTWSPSATLSSSNGNMVTANPTATTIYTITGTSGGCLATPSTATVTLMAAPLITVNSATICASGTATLTATGASSYTWSPAATLSSFTGSSVEAMPSVSTAYQVRGSNGMCTSIPVTSSVTVIQLPSLSVNSTSICAGTSATLTVNGASGYIWVPATGLSATSGSVVTANPLSTTIYTVTGFINSCAGTASSTLSVMPVQSAVFNYPSGNYCQASPVNPLPLISGATGGVFNSVPAGLSLNGSTGLINLTASLQNTYTVTYSTGGTCGETASFTIGIYPTASLTVNGYTVCEGDAAVLTATASLPGGTYTWMPGNYQTPMISVTPASSTSYVINYTLNGCPVSATAFVTVNPKPSIAIAASSTDIAEGDEVILVASGGSVYLWGDGTTQASVPVKPKETSDYCVESTDTEGCKNSACITIRVDKESTLYIPNVFTPNGDGKNDLFKIPNTNITEYNIKIFNRWGSLLFESNTPDTSWDGTYNGKDVADGLYVYTLIAKGSGNKSYEKKGHVTVLR